MIEVHQSRISIMLDERTVAYDPALIEYDNTPTGFATLDYALAGDQAVTAGDQRTVGGTPLNQRLNEQDAGLTARQLTLDNHSTRLQALGA